MYQEGRNWRRIRQIGSGGSGKAFCIEDVSSQLCLALKEVTSPLSHVTTVTHHIYHTSPLAHITTVTHQIYHTSPLSQVTTVTHHIYHTSH